MGLVYSAPDLHAVDAGLIYLPLLMFAVGGGATLGLLGLVSAITTLRNKSQTITLGIVLAAGLSTAAMIPFMLSLSGLVVHESSTAISQPAWSDKAKAAQKVAGPVDNSYYALLNQPMITVTQDLPDGTVARLYYFNSETARKNAIDIPVFGSEEHGGTVQFMSSDESVLFDWESRYTEVRRVLHTASAKSIGTAYHVTSLSQKNGDYYLAYDHVDVYGKTVARSAHWHVSAGLVNSLTVNGVTYQFSYEHTATEIAAFGRITERHPEVRATMPEGFPATRPAHLPSAFTNLLQRSCDRAKANGVISTFSRGDSDPMYPLTTVLLPRGQNYSGFAGYTYGNSNDNSAWPNSAVTNQDSGFILCTDDYVSNIRSAMLQDGKTWVAQSSGGYGPISIRFDVTDGVVTGTSNSHPVDHYVTHTTYGPPSKNERAKMEVSLQRDSFSPMLPQAPF
jgi:hypothetical protein